MPNVIFSRHAKRRMQLYKIPESIVLNILDEVDGFGKQEVVKNVFGFKLPIKIVCDIQKDKITSITAYPLKRGRK